MTSHTVESKPSPAVEWETDVSLLTHPLMLANFVKMFVITGAIMAALFGFLMLVLGEAESILPLLAMIGLILAGLVGLFVLIILVFFRNRMHMRFRVDARCAEAELIDTRAKTANKLAIIVGLLGRNPGVAGAGLIAAGNTQQKTVWDAVARARYHKAWHAVTLSNGWRTIVTLYCTAENYNTVAAAVAWALAARPAAAKAGRKNPLPKLLLHTVLILLASAPLFVLPDLDESALLPAILVLCFALATLWLVPVMAWAVFAGLGWLAVLEAMAQNEVRTSIFDNSHYRAFEVMSDEDIAMLVFAGIGAAYLILLCVGLLRGRVRSGLAGDLAEMEGGKS